ncbi:MAG: UDPGP type 1 family protein [Phycisphaerae bacterium]|jgi:UDP-N-acetylglucosamine/UDP-N-acetylgalactosamine diphosphorylase
MTEITGIRKTLEKHGQSHLLRFYDELSDRQRTVLLEQLAALDFDQMDALIARYAQRGPALELKGRIRPPLVVPTKPTTPAEQAEHKAARAKGRELLAAGKVAALMVAGGQGTRLGLEGPKGCLEATPVAHKPLFRLFAEQILAASQRYRVAIPWYVMTSQANDVATRAFFRQNRHFGLSPDDVFFFVQGTMPAFGFDGRLLLTEKGSLALSPDGHGGCLTALRRCGALDDMARRGIELISYFQVDNPLSRCIDPLFLGLHALRGAEMSAKALPKRDPMERVGNFCVLDGKVTVIEYSDLPEELAAATTEDGRLKFAAGSIAIHVLSRPFVERLTATGLPPLPFHRAEKTVPYIDDHGQLVKPDKPNAVKLEMFVFDALPLAKQTVILEIDRREEFSPIKNASGEDSLASSLHAQVRRAATWLEQAGVAVPRDADGQIAAAIEISPLFAETAEELKAKLEVKKPTIVGGQNLYLGD